MNARVAMVPARYCGLWRRDLLLTPDLADDTTSVRWLQSASGLYVDLRIPSDRDADDPVSLARQVAFAGRLSVDADMFTWDRWIDFQPPGPPDVGRIREEGGRLLEYGVYADYYEEWQCIARPAHGEVLALEALGEVTACGTRRKRAGVLLVDGEHFAYALARVQLAQGNGNGSRTTIAAPATPALRASGGLLDCIVAFGSRSGGAWRVDAATDPSLEGRPFAAAGGTWSTAGPGAYEQLQPDAVRRQWRVIERSPGLTPPSR